jgi:hypothetical protein
MQKIFDAERKESVPQSSIPLAWFGFTFGFLFLVAETLPVFLELEDLPESVLIAIFVLGWFYWLFCVHRLHRILEELTGGYYPISTGQAVAFHIIPIFNFYWVFKWPQTFAKYLTESGRVVIAPGGLLGGLLFLSFIARFFDGAISLFGMFGVLTYMTAKLRQHVKIVEESQQSALPPPPDFNAVGDE